MSEATFFSARIKSLRRELGLSQAALAQRSAVDVRHIGRIEQGTLNPKLSTIVAIAFGLGVPVGALFRSAIQPPASERSSETR